MMISIIFNLIRIHKGSKLTGKTKRAVPVFSTKEYEYSTLLELFSHQTIGDNEQKKLLKLYEITIDKFGFNKESDILVTLNEESPLEIFNTYLSILESMRDYLFEN